MSRARPVSRVAELERMVLGPLAGRPEADWQRTPSGKWTPAQIVEHLALSLEFSARGFESGVGPRVRRPKTLFERISTWFVFGVAWIPPGVRAPRRATPAARVEAVDAERHFRDGLIRWTSLESLLEARRGPEVFVHHPRMGDLSLEEWFRFHAWHCDHHARQIRRRLAG